MRLSQITLKDLVTKLRAKGRRCTLLGIGPVSKVVTQAAFEACKNYNCPAVFVASRNQVDLKELGHGYLMGGMDQKSFVDFIDRMRKQSGHEGPVYICRDHGGPWQRNKELDEAYSLEQAMEIARKSFYADIEAGFNYLHIDPTKCPLPFELENISDWTVELIKFCEKTRKSLDKGPVDYEVGTEDIKGSLTNIENFENFLENLASRLRAEDLPMPTCVVAQTGTLAKIDCNVGQFNRQQAEKLVQIAAKYGIGLKEHNGDYLSAASCRGHPDVGITAMNVAPEFGLVETDACLHLADLEQKLLREGWIKKQNTSNLRQQLLKLTWETTPWEKWMTDDIKQLGHEKIESDKFLRTLIARVCGHYVYDAPEILRARRILYDNINNFKLADDAEWFVINAVRIAIEFYMQNFNLKDVNAIR
jgi:tagatose-1,6-bisphosphate aldolase non-catalytic subunit AgaZ/GatZ